MHAWRVPDGHAKSSVPPKMEETHPRPPAGETVSGEIPIDELSMKLSVQTSLQLTRDHFIYPNVPSHLTLQPCPRVHHQTWTIGRQDSKIKNHVSFQLLLTVLKTQSSHNGSISRYLSWRPYLLSANTLNCGFRRFSKPHGDSYFAVTLELTRSPLDSKQIQSSFCHAAWL